MEYSEHFLVTWKSNLEACDLVSAQNVSDTAWTVDGASEAETRSAPTSNIPQRHPGSECQECSARSLLLHSEVSWCGHNIQHRAHKTLRHILPHTNKEVPHEPLMISKPNFHFLTIYSVVFLSRLMYHFDSTERTLS